MDCLYSFLINFQIENVNLKEILEYVKKLLMGN